MRCPCALVGDAKRRERARSLYHPIADDDTASVSEQNFWTATQTPPSSLPVTFLRGARLASFLLVALVMALHNLWYLGPPWRSFRRSTHADCPLSKSPAPSSSPSLPTPVPIVFVRAEKPKSGEADNCILLSKNESPAALPALALSSTVACHRVALRFENPKGAIQPFRFNAMYRRQSNSSTKCRLVQNSDSARAADSTELVPHYPVVATSSREGMSGACRPTAVICSIPFRNPPCIPPTTTDSLPVQKP
ncbi:hypothetical protein GGX14DRAFT_572113 [Mycena pura]|uniref:Uncharacterized protein n=1 Tax=Mycena pura TaxID=153505 RepID=A0AAD6V1Z0_9AGAR|nr:hypothetical protein GGX14DRAFT_572113 [Mycena pura]